MVNKNKFKYLKEKYKLDKGTTLIYSKSKSYYDPWNKIISVKENGTDFIFFHEMRHAIILQKNFFISFALKTIRISLISLCTIWPFILLLSSLFYSLEIVKSFMKIIGFTIISLGIIVWFEELDANIFAIKNSKDVKKEFLKSQLSYCLPFFIGIIILNME
ncbi:hypothetical protein CL684_01195 [Candidatus Campbellbacteria bacterium]|nr:hypothetical protein [Candidatus Campbellbacteria bacterium]|tara:strand:+ start:165 stop:647 length:483 start_codon:yes stop_codon:yes gene_type:complete